MIRFNFIPGFFLEKINVNPPIFKWATVQLAFRKYNRKLTSILKNRTKNSSFKRMRN